MKALIKLLAATFLLVSAGNALADENWRFSVEVGSPRGECNSRYAGNTADALGCSAIPAAARTADRNPDGDNNTGKSGVLELAQVPAGTESGPESHPTSNPEQFWTMETGEALDYAQVILSALMEQPASSSPRESESSLPAALPAEVALATNSILMPAAGQGN